MPTVCVSPPFPTFAEIYGSVTFPYPPVVPLPTIPPLPGMPPMPSFTLPVIPAMPSLPNPILPDMPHPNFEILSIIQELHGFGLIGALNIILGKFMALIPVGLPTIPGIGLSLPDLLSFNPDAIIAAIKEALANGVTFAGIVPNPLLPGIISPSLNAVLIAKLLMKKFTTLILDTVVGLIDPIVSLLVLPGVPSFPSFTIPTIDEIMARVLDAFQFQIPTLPTLPGLPQVPCFHFDLPGFPTFSIPTPLVPGFKNPALEAVEVSNILLGDTLGFVVSELTQFVTDFLGVLGFSFPEVCFSF